MVMANGDQALAAEPGFHDDAPQSGGSGMMSIHRLLDHRSELLEQQSKNGLALAVIPAAVLGGVMEDGAGGAALEATAGPVVEVMGGEFHGQGEGGRCAGRGVEPLIQGGLQIADAFFFRAIVAGKVRWIVEGQHAEAGEHGIHGVVIKGGAVIAFEEQRRAVLAEEFFQVGGDLAAVEAIGDEGRKAVA